MSCDLSFPVSEAPKEAPAAKKFASYNPNYKTDEEKKEEVSYLLFRLSFPEQHLPSLPPPSFPSPLSPPQLLTAMVQKMGEKDDDPLPQETMDGCESDEWSD